MKIETNIKKYILCYIHLNSNMFWNNLNIISLDFISICLKPNWNEYNFCNESAFEDLAN